MSKVYRYYKRSFSHKPRCLSDTSCDHSTARTCTFQWFTSGNKIYPNRLMEAVSAVSAGVNPEVRFPWRDAGPSQAPWQRAFSSCCVWQSSSEPEDIQSEVDQKAAPASPCSLKQTGRKSFPSLCRESQVALCCITWSGLIFKRKIIRKAGFSLLAHVFL